MWLCSIVRQRDDSRADCGQPNQRIFQSDRVLIDSSQAFRARFVSSSPKRVHKAESWGFLGQVSRIKTRAPTVSEQVGAYRTKQGVSPAPTVTNSSTLTKIDRFERHCFNIIMPPRTPGPVAGR